jgi:tetratricopeptide (TPR) repeat protein
MAFRELNYCARINMVEQSRVYSCIQLVLQKTSVDFLPIVSIIPRMRFLCTALGVMMISCVALGDAPPVPGQEVLPVPTPSGPSTAPAPPWAPPAPSQIYPDEDALFLKARLNELLLQLDVERKALGAAQDATAREYQQGIEVGTRGNAFVKLRIKELLVKLHRQQAEKVVAISPPAIDTEPGKGKSSGAAGVKQPEKFPLLPPEKDSPGVIAPQIVDPLALGHALFRAGNFDGALRAFRMIDLKGTKADQRAPIQYLIASCLHHLGKTEEAGALYREVANTLGDDPVATCAQWQLAALRWHKQTQERLAEIRLHRAALEKQP